MFDILFLDLDDTILDFKKAERIAIAATIRNFGVEPTEEVLARYHKINKHQWELLEKGEKTRAQILVDRFALLFEELGADVDAEKCARPGKTAQRPPQPFLRHGKIPRRQTAQYRYCRQKHFHRFKDLHCKPFPNPLPSKSRGAAKLHAAGKPGSPAAYSKSA